MHQNIDLSLPIAVSIRWLVMFLKYVRYQELKAHLYLIFSEIRMIKCYCLYFSIYWYKYDWFSYKYSISHIVKYTLLRLTNWFSRLSIILLWTRCSPWISFTSREIFSNFDIISWISSRELWHILSSVSFEVLNADILACRSCSLLKIHQTLVIDKQIMDCLKNGSHLPFWG